jgi:hypothetical protein
VIVASISELSQICRIGGRGIVRNYTAEEVKFTSPAVRIISSIRQALLRVQRTRLLEVPVPTDQHRDVVGVPVVRVDALVLRLDEESGELDATTE